MSAPSMASSISSRWSSAAGFADLGVAAGAEAAGELATDVELDVGVAHEQRLGVGVDGDELDALSAGVDHPVDGVDAAAADADDLDDGQVVLRVGTRLAPSTSMWSTSRSALRETPHAATQRLVTPMATSSRRRRRRACRRRTSMRRARRRGSTGGRAGGRSSTGVDPRVRRSVMVDPSRHGAGRRRCRSRGAARSRTPPRPWPGPRASVRGCRRPSLQRRPG
jgi:hypothetical protein